MSSLPHILMLHRLFEAERVTELRSLAAGDRAPSERRLAELLVLCHEGRWEEIDRAADEIVRTAEDLHARALALHMAVAACEINYDENRRAGWLQHWKGLKGSLHDDYCLWLRTFHEALTAFFAGNLRDSEARLLQAMRIADRMQDRHAQAIAHFHLGLIYHEQNLTDKARRAFVNAYDIAASEGLSRLQRRAAARIESASGELTLDEIVALLNRGNVRAAKRLATHVCRVRRVEKRSRESGFELMMLALVAAGEKRLRAFDVILGHIHDPIMRAKILGLGGQFAKPSPELECERAWLEETYGIHRLLSERIATGDIAEGRSKSVKRLLALLLANPDGVDKERICEEVFGLSYDPIVHDSKIYKLVLHARRTLGHKDGVVNEYGTYRLDPRRTRGAS